MGTRWERIGLHVTQCRVLEDNTKYLKVTVYLWSSTMNSFEIFVTNFQGELQLYQPTEVLLLH
jgi:hypothetical protein